MTKRLALAVALALTIITIGAVVALGHEGGLFGSTNSGGASSSTVALSPSATVGSGSQAVLSSATRQEDLPKGTTIRQEDPKPSKTFREGLEGHRGEKRERHDDDDD